MNKLRFFPEIICISLFIISSMFWSYSSRKHEQLNEQLSELTRLQTVLTEHKIQLLSANFSEQLHYDSFAQLQSQIESISYHQAVNSELQDLLNDYTQLSLSYIQLVTMIKTSQRLLSNDNQVNDKQTVALLNIIQIQLFKFIISPNPSIKHSAFKLLAKLEDNNLQDDGVAQLKLFKLHFQFVLDNYESMTSYRQQLMNMPVLAKIISTISLQHHEIVTEQYHRYITGSGSLLSLFLIFLIILKRQQYALKQSSDAYQHAAKVKTQFLANMSHEIRTPMTGIIGLIDLCLKTELDEEQQSYLEKVQFSANSLLTIINDILDFSKIESGQLMIENIPFEHHKVIDNLNVMLGRIAEEKNIELIFDLEPNIPEFIVGDPVRLTQILLNLLSNAVKFTEAGHVVLSISLGTKETENNIHESILYKIEDTGIGLTTEAQTKLFKRFSQADDSTTRKYGGTGLGLVISKLLVESMQGTIDVKSQPGKGSIFSIRLPLIIEDSDNSPLMSKLALPNKKHQGLRLLLLEDNTITQGVIAKMAEYCGVTIDITSTVEHAKFLCQSHAYDIALIDWSLKGETGLDFVLAIHQESYCPQLLVICSAYSKNYIETHSTFDFNLHYLAKPITLLSFSKILDLYLQPNESTMLQTSINEKEPTEKVESQLIGENGEPADILLVEDNKINQTIATRLLESLGLHVDVAEDGCEAIEMIMAKKYPVVLMDIQMPKMDGMEATIELRKTFNQAQLKIIALTANVTAEDIDYYKRIGMNGHLGKPYEIDKIRALLMRYFDVKNELKN